MLTSLTILLVLICVILLVAYVVIEVALRNAGAPQVVLSVAWIIAALIILIVALRHFGIG